MSRQSPGAYAEVRVYRSVLSIKPICLQSGQVRRIRKVSRPAYSSEKATGLPTISVTRFWATIVLHSIHRSCVKHVTRFHV